jgi:hypothetical protein
MEEKTKRNPEVSKTNNYILAKIGALLMVCICTVVTSIIFNDLPNMIVNIMSESLTISLELDTVMVSDSHHPACGIITIYNLQKQENGTFALINTADDTLNSINFDYLELDGYRFTDVVDVSAARRNGNRDSYRFLYQLPFEGKQGLTVAIREGFSESTNGFMVIVLENHEYTNTAFRPELALCDEP